MERHEEIVELLRRIEANQRQALEAQERQLAFAKSQLERSERVANESVALQKTAIDRHRRIGYFALPLVVVLLALLVWLLVRWRVLF